MLHFRAYTRTRHPGLATAKDGGSARDRRSGPSSGAGMTMHGRRPLIPNLIDNSEQLFSARTGGAEFVATGVYHQQWSIGRVTSPVRTSINEIAFGEPMLPFAGGG
jgi:hypothetical protein